MQAPGIVDCPAALTRQNFGISAHVVFIYMEAYHHPCGLTFHLLRNGMAPSSPTLMHLLPSRFQGLKTTMAAIISQQTANCPWYHPMQAKLGSLPLISMSHH